jgi:hypothetical protein
MKILLVAALLVATALPARAGLTDERQIQGISIVMVMQVMCGVQDGGLVYRRIHAIAEERGLSWQTIESAAKTFAMQIIDHLTAQGTQAEFCRINGSL